ncbi:hypothetical protein MLD38_003841 [Melastoma candidum]|uniref:Uncharacterized protein n=1 Tax=Melastoma candidum TaxID=119954 RepID=A0ACB9S706_9MYRT|nr:hypothetical protein MLD38_003841 [Melastoma candidum]
MASSISDRKRKRGGGGGDGRVFRFKTFGEQGNPAEFDGRCFLENLRQLLDYGHFEGNDVCFRGFPCWSFVLEVNRQPPVHVVLLVIEEPFDPSSLGQGCKPCLFVGWGQHLICNSKYHFLLPSLSKESLSKESLSKESRLTHLDEPTPHMPSTTRVERVDLTETRKHVMHGVFHSNGFGHLLWINGLGSGSDLHGHRIMGLWDRLCTGLRARKVSLCDVSQKRGMELRLLHGLAYGNPWFGRWGYQFFRGSFGITLPVYKTALEAIQTVPLSLLMNDLGNSSREFQYIFSSYNEGILLETSCRWSRKRVDLAIRVIVEALRKAEFRWVSRQEVRDAARAYIGDTGLLDFVLKSLGNHMVGHFLVRRCLNPVTKVLEYCLEDMSKEPNSNNLNTVRTRPTITRIHILKDLFYLYGYLFKEQYLGANRSIIGSLQIAARIILDAKHLVKEYEQDLPSKVDIGLGAKLMIFCTVLLKDCTVKPVLPYECIVLKDNATVNDLKAEVERRFRELYFGLRSFVAESLAAKGPEMLFGLVEVGRRLVIEGSCNYPQGSVANEMLEWGEANYRVVDCGCGAAEDDGERMIACDICEVMQHSRCVRIPDCEELPHIFLCKRCEEEITLLSNLA